MGAEEIINHYAKARVGIRKITSAAGFVALLLSSVVLLGGFVSSVQIKDFWFLTVLSLVMASKTLELLDTNAGGMYVGAEKYILRLSKLVYQDRQRPTHSTIKVVLSAAIIVKTVLLLFVSSIYLVSTHVSIALSVARLVQQDYGDADGDAANKAKLNAALIIFYVLVIFHGLSVFYWGFLNESEPWILVGKQLGFGIWGPKVVRKYRAKTGAMCRKDGVLPSNWNLITFSVGLLESASQEDRLWGARVLDNSIGKGISIGQELLSSSQAIQNLIDMIGLTRTDNPEIRERASRILADIASRLPITQFPEALRCICCLLESCNRYSGPEVSHPSENSEKTLDKNSHKVSVGTFEHANHQEDAHLSLAITEQADHKQVVNLVPGKVNKRRSWIQTLRIRRFKTRTQMRDWERYFGDNYYYSYVSKGTKELISQSLMILLRLTQDKENCLEIIKHQRLLSKITLPLSYQNLLNHGWDHTWTEMLSRSLTIVSRLIRAGAGEDTTRLRHDMSRNTVAIGNLMRILEVDSEGAFSELRGQAIEILTELAFDGSFRKLAFDESTSMIEMLVKMLRHIMLEESNAIVAKQDEEKVNTVRRKAGEALARLLCVPSAIDDSDASTSTTNFNAVDLLPKRDMIKLLTRVVNQILSSKGEKAADMVTLPHSSNGFHVEMVVESQSPNGADTRQSSTQETEEQPEDRKMLAAMLSLTVAICNNKNMISGDDFSGAIPDDAALVKKLKEIAETNMDATADGWRIQKLVCEMVMAVVQLKPSYIRKLNEHNFKEALSKALETMSDVDNCMIFGGHDREVPARSLASLVKEALELLAQDQGDISV